MALPFTTTAFQGNKWSFYREIPKEAVLPWEMCFPKKTNKKKTTKKTVLPKEKALPQVKTSWRNFPHGDSTPPQKWPFSQQYPVLSTSSGLHSGCCSRRLKWQWITEFRRKTTRSERKEIQFTSTCSVCTTSYGSALWNHCDLKKLSCPKRENKHRAKRKQSA